MAYPFGMVRVYLISRVDKILHIKGDMWRPFLSDGMELFPNRYVYEKQFSSTMIRFILCGSNLEEIYFIFK